MPTPYSPYAGSAIFSFGARLLEELVRDLHQNPGAIARVRLAAARAAVAQIHEDRERLADDLVRFPALDVDDKADAAGVVFETRIVQALFLRPAIRCDRADVTHCMRSQTRLGA